MQMMPHAPSIGLPGSLLYIKVWQLACPMNLEATTLLDIIKLKVRERDSVLGGRGRSRRLGTERYKGDIIQVFCKVRQGEKERDRDKVAGRKGERRRERGRGEGIA